MRMQYYYRMVGFPIILFLLSLAVIGFLILPGLNQLSLLQNEIEVKHKTLTKLTAKVNDLRTIDSSTIEGMGNRLLFAIPSTNHYLTVLANVKSRASSSGVTLVKLQLNPGALDASKTNSTGTVANEVSVVADIVGSFDGIKQMVDGFEETLPIIRVAGMSFDNKIASTSGSLMGIKANIKLVAYWSGLPSNLGNYDAPLDKLTPEDYATASLFETKEIVSTPELVEGNNSSLPVGRENPFPF